MGTMDKALEWMARASLWVLTLWYWYYLTRLLLVSDPWAFIGGYTLTGHEGPDTGATLPSLLIHFCCYFVGSLLALASCYGQRRSTVAFTLLLIIAHAAGTEYLQQWVPQRFPSLIDMTSDLLGMALAWLVVYRFGKPSIRPLATGRRLFPAN